MDHDDYDGDVQVIEVISDDVGRIIGKGGAKIRSLEADTGCRIKVERNKGRDSTYTKVELDGSKESRDHLIEIISKFVTLKNDDGGNDENNGGGGLKQQFSSRSRGFGSRNIRDGDGGNDENNGGGGLQQQFSSRSRGFGGARSRNIRDGDGGNSRDGGFGRRNRYNDGNSRDGGFGFGFGSSNRRNDGYGRSNDGYGRSNDGWKRNDNSFGRYQRDDSPSKTVKNDDTDDNGTLYNTKYPPIDWASIHASRAEAESKKWIGLEKVIKEFYHEDAEIASMSIDVVEQLRLEKNGISVVDLSDNDRPPPNPVLTFQQAFAKYPDVLENLHQRNFKEPTPIQSQAWPILLKGYDMVGIAQTGTGKTLAFLLPAIVHIEGQITPLADRKGPSAIVLSPTRELAIQIEQEAHKFAYKKIRSVCIYGGGNRREQIEAVKRGVEIVIATPGRLNDLVMNEIISLRYVTYLILDEADRMLDMGFEPQIKKVLLDIRPDRQTVMTSATWPPGVRRLAESYMKDPFQVNVGTLDLRACVLVEQTVEFVEDCDKKQRILQFIANMGDNDKVLVFCSRKATADDLASDLLLHGLPVQSIHGDREQCDREQALEDFKTGVAPILVATDVASRGLDIQDITYVINYDFPMHIEDYVHRVGRTGRAGATGKALTFMSRNNWKWARSLIKILSDASQVVPDELVAMATRYESWRERNADRRRY